MNASSSVILLTLTVWHLLLYRGWAGAPANTTGATCNTGSSRLVLANLDHLPQECKPGHHAVAAAVFECFSSWRVSVQNCRLTVVPGRAASRAGLDCKVMHAQGSLQGPTNATLIAVLDGSKVADLLPKLPGHSSSTLFQGLDAAMLQQQLLTGLQLLFTKVVVTHSSSQGKTNATTQLATTAAEAVQPQAHASPGPVPASAAATTRGSSSSSSGAAAGVRARRHRQRHRPRARPQQQNTTTDMTAHAQQAPDSPPNSPPATSATAAMTTNSSSNASSSTGTTAGDHSASSQSTPAAPAAATNSTGAAASDITAKQGQVAAPAHTPPGGRRRLLQQLMWTADKALSGHWPGLHRAWARPPVAGPEAVTAAEIQPQHQASSSTAAHTARAAARQLMAASATAERAQAAALFRHDGSVILQSNSRCSYQFLVTRNPGLLSMQPQQQGLQHGASSGGEGSSHKGSSWWISAGALFAGVSAVLALAICFMSAQLWARYKSYDALPTEPAPAEGEQQEQAAGHSSTGDHFAGTSGQTTRGPTEMSLELQHTSTAKPRAEGDGDKTLLQDQERS